MKSIKSALDILDCFTPDVQEIGVMEIARKLDMHKSKVSRILAALAEGGLLTRSGGNQQYRLGQKVAELATIFVSNVDLRTFALPWMKNLREETRETVTLFVPFEDCRICVERLESPEVVKTTSRVGERHPLHAGSAGKLLLAYLLEEKRKTVIEGTNLKKFTPHTITKKKQLEKEIKRIRKQGFAVSFEEHIPFAASVSVPIKNMFGEVIAALSVSGPAVRFNNEKIEKFIEPVKKTAKSISEELGYRVGIEKRLGLVAATGRTAGSVESHRAWPNKK
jgi:IclR family KDG regulon transcriptional repressor